MSDKYCCCTWTELSLELITAKETEINDLISTKGLPRSIFASVLKVLDQMQNYCPVCGGQLRQVAMPDSIKQPVKTKNTNPIAKIQKQRCNRCSGKGVLGHEGKDNYLGSSIPIKCMNCHGEGWVDSRHIVEENQDEVEHEKVIEKRIEEFEKQGEDSNGN